MRAISEDSSVKARSAIAQAERPKKLAENVAARLLNYITSEGLAPGTALPSQTLLLQSLDVGKASLREALRFLEMHGFIELRAGRNGGPIVGDVSSRSFARMSTMYFHALGVTVREVMDARLVLEPATVRAIAERGLDAEIVEQLQSFGSAGYVKSAHEPGSIWTHDFHLSIAKLSHNAVLKLVAESTREIYQGVARDVIQNPTELEEIEHVHQDITDAILAGDGSTAQSLMADHLRQVIATYERTHPHLLDARITWP